MIAAYTTEGWGDLFLAAAGATAALSGLIFVGLSVNIGTVLAIDKRQGENFLTGRALEALAALLTVLVISLIGLVPAIPRGALAAFILLTGVASTISPVRALLSSRRGSTMDGPLLLRLRPLRLRRRQPPRPRLRRGPRRRTRGRSPACARHPAP